MSAALYNPLLGERIGDELGGWYSADGLTLYRPVETPGATLAALVGPAGETLYASPNAALLPPAPPQVDPAEVAELRARLAAVEAERDELAAKLDEAARLIDRFQVELAPLQAAMAELRRRDAEIAATQAALARPDLPPGTRVAIAVAIHATGAYRAAVPFGEQEPTAPAPSRIEVASTAAAIGMHPRTFGAALIVGDKLGIIARSEETCMESFADGSTQYKTIVRLGPPIAVVTPPAARPARQPVARVAVPAAAAATPPPNCADCNAAMVPIAWACPRCDAQIDAVPGSGVEKLHTVYGLDKGVEKQHMTLVGPAAGANGGDGAAGVAPPADPCGSCGRRMWTRAPYDPAVWLCSRCGVDAF